MKHITIIALAATLTVASCANDPNRNTKRGAVIGAVAGGVLGHQVDGDKGRFIGAAVGAIAGGAAGNYMDRQRRELEKQLAEEAKRNELQITTLADNSIKIGIASDVSFDTGSASLKPAALTTFNKIATILQDYESTVVHVVGHTDTTGSAQFNQGLSERRAASVGSVLTGQGVLPSRIRQEGRGERELLVRTADNVNEARNRRVDIVLKPIIEGNESAAYTPPPNLGS